MQLINVGFLYYIFLSFQSILPPLYDCKCVEGCNTIDVSYASVYQPGISSLKLAPYLLIFCLHQVTDLFIDIILLFTKLPEVFWIQLSSFS